MTTELTKEWRDRAEQAGWTEGEEECFAKMPSTTVGVSESTPAPTFTAEAPKAELPKIQFRYNGH